MPCEMGRLSEQDRPCLSPLVFLLAVASHFVSQDSSTLSLSALLGRWAGEDMGWLRGAAVTVPRQPGGCRGLLLSLPVKS